MSILLSVKRKLAQFDAWVCSFGDAMDVTLYDLMDERMTKIEQRLSELHSTTPPPSD